MTRGLYLLVIALFVGSGQSVLAFSKRRAPEIPAEYKVCKKSSQCTWSRDACCDRGPINVKFQNRWENETEAACRKIQCAGGPKAYQPCYEPGCPKLSAEVLECVDGTCETRPLKDFSQAEYGVCAKAATKEEQGFCFESLAVRKSDLALCRHVPVSDGTSPSEETCARVIFQKRAADGKLTLEFCRELEAFIPSDETVYCEYRVAKQGAELSERFCLNRPDTLRKGFCFEELAIATGDESFCRHIHVERHMPRGSGGDVSKADCMKLVPKH